MPVALRTTLRVVFLIALVAAFAAGLTTPSEVPDLLDHQDKVGHFFAFLALGLLGFTAWPNHRLAIMVVLLAHGASMEYAQSMTDHRRGDPWDWLADAMGAGTAALLVAWIDRPQSGRRCP